MRRFRVVVNGLVYEVGVEELDEGGSPPAPASVLQAAPAPAKDGAEGHRSRSQVHGAPPAPVAKAPAHTDPAPAGGEVVEAPLPGTVLDVKVASGDQVTTGQVLLVLEAMKMENEIVAPRDGTIEEVLVAKGSAVTTGDALLRIA